MRTRRTNTSWSISWTNLMCYTCTNTHTHKFTHLPVKNDEVWTHLSMPTIRSTLSYEQPTTSEGTGSHCQLSGSETTGGMCARPRARDYQTSWRLILDPAFISPLTPNPWHICIHCLVCFSRGVMLCRLGRATMLCYDGGGGPHRVLRWPYPYLV